MQERSTVTHTLRFPEDESKLLTREGAGDSGRSRGLGEASREVGQRRNNQRLRHGSMELPGALIAFIVPPELPELSKWGRRIVSGPGTQVDAPMRPGSALGLAASGVSDSPALDTSCTDQVLAATQPTNDFNGTHTSLFSESSLSPASRQLLWRDAAQKRPLQYPYIVDVGRNEAIEGRSRLCCSRLS
jgi:hypothetical protein